VAHLPCASSFIIPRPNPNNKHQNSYSEVGGLMATIVGDFLRACGFGNGNVRFRFQHKLAMATDLRCDKTGSVKRGTHNKEHATRNKQQATSNKQQATRNTQHAICNIIRADGK
jgi:hypothetical protein